jgi:N-acetylglucosamine PTS system EIICBA or EIICB component
MASMNFLGLRLGLRFSSGAFDYITSYGLGTNGWMLILVGFAASPTSSITIYYFLFSFAIRKSNLATPDRAEASLEPTAEGVSITGGALEAGAALVAGAPALPSGAVGFVRALNDNRKLKLVDACTTRPVLEVADDSLVHEPALRTLGAGEEPGLPPNYTWTDHSARGNRRPLLPERSGARIMRSSSL